MRIGERVQNRLTGARGTVEDTGSVDNYNQAIRVLDDRTNTSYWFYENEWFTVI